jgi:large subunit ribosomal protein L4
MKVPVYNQKAEAVGEIDLNPKIFEVKPNMHLLAEAIRVYLSNARASISNTKTRGEVRGGGKKPWKQKGTGRARAGSIRGPLWRHGGVAFGPRASRNWELKLNKKAKTKALFMALSEKAKESKFIVIDHIVLEKPKTKEFVRVLEAFKKHHAQLGRKLMLLLPKADEKLMRACRNIPSLSPKLATSLNVYDVLNADSLCVLRDSLAVIEKTYLKSQTSE